MRIAELREQGADLLRPQLGSLKRLTCGGSAPQPELMHWFLDKRLGSERTVNQERPEGTRDALAHGHLVDTFVRIILCINTFSDFV